jgi:glycosyltransferase involved in cell wall biosynthesis
MSGVEEYAKNVIERLIESSEKHEFILFFNAFGPRPDFSWVPKRECVRWVYARIPNKLLNVSLWYFRRPYIDRFIGGVDVFFAPNPTFLSVSPSCRLVITAHDLSFEIFPETFSIKRRLWHMFVSPRRLFRRANRIIAVSQSTKDDVVCRYGIDPKKVSVIYCGVSDTFAPMSRNNPKLLEVKKRYELPYRFILFLGTFEPRKNIAGLVRAYSAFRSSLGGNTSEKPPQLILAGPSGWKEWEIEREISESPYCEDIRRIGFVRSEDKSAIYALSTVFAYPSLYEGFGFPVVEAMRCGGCVITSATSSLGEVAGDGAILVDPFRSDELAVVLKEVFRDNELRANMSQRALRSSARFSWRHCARDTERAIVEV